MADVRAMLRAERASRTPQKAKAPPKPAPPAAIPASKKRKATPTEDDAADIHKRARSDTANNGASRVPTPPVSKPAAHVQLKVQGNGEDKKPSVIESSDAVTQSAISAVVSQSAIDEDEWAAFERDVATPPAEAHAPSALDAIHSSNAISAAPMTADELAAQAREEQSIQRGRTDAEQEGEKEDAEQALADEFEEMDALEARVKRLRERRESIRKGRVNIEDEDTTAEVGTSKVNTVPATKKRPPPDILEEGDEDNEDEEGDEGDDWDDWQFRVK